MNKYMSLAYEQAIKAKELGEIPIGCVIVKDDEVIASAHNLREASNDISSHAEINALKIAAHKLDSWKLDKCEMYITIEPCLMCYGAILQSRIKTIYVGYEQLDFKKHSYRGYIIDSDIEVVNLNSQECANLLTDFFKDLRKD